MKQLYSLVALEALCVTHKYHRYLLQFCSYYTNFRWRYDNIQFFAYIVESTYKNVSNTNSFKAATFITHYKRKDHNLIHILCTIYILYITLYIFYSPQLHLEIKTIAGKEKCNNINS